AGQPVIVGIRPEDIDDLEIDPTIPADQRIRVDIELVEALGAEIMAHFTIDAPAAETGDPDAIEEVGSAEQTKCVARLDPRSRIKLRDTVELGVHTARLHFFEPGSGAAVWE